MDGGVGGLRRAEEQFRRWLRLNFSACQFATNLAGAGNRITTVTVPEPPSALEIDQIFDECAASDTVPIVILPLLSAEVELVALLNELPTASKRWALRRRPKVNPPGSGLPIGIEWITRAGQVSEVMGFGPLPSMPVTRRSPYVALASWPGSHRNPWRQPGKTKRRVSFIDAFHDIDSAKHETMNSDTESDVGELLADSGDRADHYRQVAFVVGRRFEGDVRFGLPA